MRYRDSYRRNAFRRQSRCVGNAVLPLLGLCEIRTYDGKAVLIPGHGGVLIRDWFSWCSFQRRHR